MTDPLAPDPLALLSEPAQASLDELFSTDPLSLTDTRVDTIAAALRTQRTEYVASGGKGRAKKLTISDLDIQL